MTDPQGSAPKGYGNIYTPHAGSMVIQVQREGGLANRTITLTPGQVRLLKHGWRIGGTLLFIGVITWIFLAFQASRVPILTRRLTQMQTDLRRVDTLKAQLAEMERRFTQVQRMLSAPAGGSSTNRAVQMATTETPAPRRASRRAAAVTPDTANANVKSADSVRTTPPAADSLVSAPERPTVASP
ncbi:MAG TPA: hypothetical protein VJ596_08245 [Gemmatimonadaceae bacterium]|nr:hypothetical protein [Gemmatimonadaceae bacterium]